MSILDISNWTINEINNSIDTFKDTSLTDIGMVNCDIDSINIVGEVTTATLWIDEDIGIDGYTGTAPLKVYKEDKIEIKLNSPLLRRDSIEVVDGKLCHYHKMGMVVLDGSEDEGWKLNNTFYYITNIRNVKKSNQQDSILCDTLQPTNGITLNTPEIIGIYIVGQLAQIRIRIDSINSNPMQWLQANPTTVVYELAEPYYEDITPLQSSIILKTFLESSMTINTNLPIKTNVSYRTNVPSISTLSNRVTEVSESDNVIHNLMNIIDDEVDE